MILSLASVKPNDALKQSNKYQISLDRPLIYATALNLRLKNSWLYLNVLLDHSYGPDHIPDFILFSVINHLKRLPNFDTKRLFVSIFQNFPRS